MVPLSRQRTLSSLLLVLTLGTLLALSGCSSSVEPDPLETSDLEELDAGKWGGSLDHELRQLLGVLLAELAAARHQVVDLVEPALMAATTRSPSPHTLVSA